jgi:hypothetical protein
VTAARKAQSRWNARRDVRAYICQAAVSYGRLSVKVQPGRKADKRVYQCRGDAENGREGLNGCHLAVKADAAEEVVRDAVLEWQGRPRRLAKMTKANAVVDSRVAALEAEVARLTEVSKRNNRKLQSGIWSQEEYDELDGPNDLRILAAKEELASLSKPAVLRELAVETLTMSWDAASTDERRTMIAVALKAITVAPSPGNGKSAGHDPRSRIICEPRS